MQLFRKLGRKVDSTEMQGNGQYAMSLPSIGNPCNYSIYLTALDLPNRAASTVQPKKSKCLKLNTHVRARIFVLAVILNILSSIHVHVHHGRYNHTFILTACMVIYHTLHLLVPFLMISM